MIQCLDYFYAIHLANLELLLSCSIIPLSGILIQNFINALDYIHYKVPNCDKLA